MKYSDAELEMRKEMKLAMGEEKSSREKTSLQFYVDLTSISSFSFLDYSSLKPPEEYCCPISDELMKNPVQITDCGDDTCFEKNILKYFEENEK